MKSGRSRNASDKDVSVSYEYHEEEGEGEEQRARISRLVLDVLKPRQITAIQLGEGLTRVDGVSKVSIASREVDSETETLRISIDGTEIDYEKVVYQIDNFGATIKSVDEVILER
jgi:hypothetical protein